MELYTPKEVASTCFYNDPPSPYAEKGLSRYKERRPRENRAAPVRKGNLRSIASSRRPLHIYVQQCLTAR